MWLAHNFLAFLFNEISFRTILFIFLLTLIFKYFLDKLKKNPLHVKFADILPGPPAFPLLGNGSELMKKMDGSMEIFKSYEKKYGSIYKLWFGKHLVVVVSDINALEEVFSSSKTLSRPEIFNPAREFWGDSMFTTNLHLWKKSRKALQPFFMKGSLANHVPKMQKIIDGYNTKLKNYVHEPEFDFGKIAPELTFDIIMEILFNAKFDWQDRDISLVSEIFQMGDLIFFEKMFKPWLSNSIIDHILYRKQKRIFKKEVDKFFKAIKTKYESRLQKEGRSTSLFPILHKIKEELKLEEGYIQEESIIMISAGLVTTAVTLSFCLLALAIHPETQEKLYTEIIEKFPNDQYPKADDLEKMPYLDQVLRETERCFTLAPIMIRNVDEDMKIGPYTFPSGTALLIPICNLHFDPKYYNNPNKFDPEHFSFENTRKRPKHAFIPFAAGGRGCIGKALAELELKLALVTLLKTYKFETKTTMDDICIVPGPAIFNANGYKVSIHLR